MDIIKELINILFGLSLLTCGTVSILILKYREINKAMLIL
jgi:hypothetical protein